MPIFELAAVRLELTFSGHLIPFPVVPIFVEILQDFEENSG